MAGGAGPGQVETPEAGRSAMSPSPGETKRSLRTQVRTALQALPPATKAEGSLQICRQVANQTLWAQARIILVYAALPEEPDLQPLIQQALDVGKTVVLPKFCRQTGQYTTAQIQEPHRQLEPGNLRILEPNALCPEVDPKRLDLALVPGVGFDMQGHRLGRGRGYLDRLLAGVPAVKCGVAFDCQILPAVPFEPHDIRMNFIVTPTQWRACQAGVC